MLVLVIFLMVKLNILIDERNTLVGFHNYDLYMIDKPP